MNYEELKEYFDNAVLPETIQIERATTQYEVARFVKQDLESLKINPNDQGCRHRLMQIKNAIEVPYQGR